MRRRRFRRFLRLVLPAVVLVAIIGFTRNMRPLVRELAKAKVENHGQNVINEAIERQLELREIDYDNLVSLEKDVHGTVTALKTNIAQINRLKTQILMLTDAMLLDMDVAEIGLPLGSLIFPMFFSGSGPRLPVKVLSISNSDAEFCNVFSEAGINQTSHRIMMDVMIDMTILTPVGTDTVRAVSSVVVAETVIVGSVPQSYVNIGDQT